MTAASVIGQEAGSLHSGAEPDACRVVEEGGGVEEEEEEEVLKDPHSRMLGGTEHNWCRAVGAGTGITVLALLFSNHLDKCALQSAITSVQVQHPRLRSQLLWIQGRPAFKVSRQPVVQVEEEVVVVQDEGAEDPTWLHFVEQELNTNIWPEEHHNLSPVPMFLVRLYRLPRRQQSVVILRLHTAACDRASAATILVEILRCMQQQQQQKGGADDCLLQPPPPCLNLLPVEDAIPKGHADKPFWAHGLDLVGYSLGSRRHASLPFEETNQARRSQIIVSSLSKDHTQQLLQACSRAQTCLYGAICAAGLKAAAAMKQTGSRGEHYAVVSLVDCRKYLKPVLPDPSVGFYHSALMNTHHVSEAMEFWEVARRSSQALSNALKNRKHFTDMGDLNFLMSQALQHPHLTPFCSLRTSLLVLFLDDIQDDLDDSLRHSLGLQDYMGCSSIHGVGPSLTVFHSIRSGSLHCTNLYPAPLHSRHQMQHLVNHMMQLLISSSSSLLL